MFKISPEEHVRLHRQLSGMEREWRNWSPHQQELARYLLPRRYQFDTNFSTGFEASIAIQHNDEKSRGKRNEYIIDPMGTTALRVLASGMMNGVTSPARPWFTLRFSDLNYEETSITGKIYLQEVVRRMLIVLAESNFYNSMASLHLDFAGFGTAGMLVYEDFDDIVRFYVSPPGEYRLAQDNRLAVSTFARTFSRTVEQIVGQWGAENVSQEVLSKYRAGGANLQTRYQIFHLIEPNRDDSLKIDSRFDYREMYWESRQTDGSLLSLAGFHEKAHVTPRWEITGGDTYGISPAHDALPEIIQLQHMVRRKAQALDKMVSPPILADISMSENPTALFPGGVSYVSFAASTIGAKPIYTVNPPFAELAADMQELHARIQRIFHNHLFTGVSDLNTVRSATEIVERTNEKLVMLGPVLERFEHEALDPIIRRTFGIMQRGGLLPEVPEEFAGAGIEVQYVSILSNAQRSQTTAATERFFEVVGNLAAISPEILDVPNFEELLRDYADKLQVPAKGINPRAVVSGLRQAREAQQQAQEAALVGNELTSAAQNLSQTDVGGGQNALQALIG